ncbi:hypothetical protein F5X96DRAFT_670872 [Biscogniauxia mediterranea]|nr:hypothetical protein F5X96DRAFT_670872 [Biscogniauxia mediterranea]
MRIHRTVAAALTAFVDIDTTSDTTVIVGDNEVLVITVLDKGPPPSPPLPPRDLLWLPGTRCLDQPEFRPQQYMTIYHDRMRGCAGIAES